jgi:hypothetical protein
MKIDLDTVSYSVENGKPTWRCKVWHCHTEEEAILYYLLHKHYVPENLFPAIVKLMNMEGLSK